MITRKCFCGVVTCTLLALGRIGGAQTADDRITVPLSDPTRAGTVRARLVMGSITVRPGTGRDIVVTTSRGQDPDDERRERERERDREPDEAAQGLRRLTQPGGVTIQEENNTVTITASAVIGRTNITLEVPPATSLVLRTVTGQVLVERVTGTIEVNNVNGSVRLTDVGGPVVAHTTNGRVNATLRTVPANTPMSFTSFNGSVDVTLPASAKASLKLRSDRGDVYTDFDVQTTQPPADRGQSDTRRDRRRDRDADPDDARGSRPRYRLDVDRAIYGTINGGGPDLELRTFNGNIYLRKAR
jgi:hypothetical protein